MSGEPIERGDQDAVICPPSRTREAIGAFSGLLAIVEGRHAARAVISVFDGCHSAGQAAAVLMSLPDLAFAGFLFYGAALAAISTGLIWGLHPLVASFLTRPRGKS